MPAAMPRARGVKTAKIAILDSGIDQDHPDLSGKVADQYDFVEDDAVANDPTGTAPKSQA